MQQEDQEHLPAQQEEKNEIIEIAEGQLTDSIILQETSQNSKTWFSGVADVLRVHVPLGLFAFGGASRLALFYDTYVNKNRWVSDTQFTELQSLLQGVPGPTAVQLVSSISTIRGGYIAGMLAFLCFSVPSMFMLMAIAYFTSFAESSNPPRWLYGVQKGLSCATVGFSISTFLKMVKKVSGETFYALLLTASVLTTMMYRAAWVFPALIISGGLMSLLYKLLRAKIDARVKKYKLSSLDPATDSIWTTGKKTYIFLRSFWLPEPAKEEEEGKEDDQKAASGGEEKQQHQMEDADLSNVNMRPAFGVLFLGLCVAIFIANTILRYLLQVNNKSFHMMPSLVKLFFVFESFYRYGIMAFGNGSVFPMIIQELAHEAKLISLHQFLNSYAISQVLPGPAFNYVVYLGFLLYGVPGAITSYIGLFLPAYFISLAVLAFWKGLRNNATVSRFLKGANAIAVGFSVTGNYLLFFAAVDFGHPITSAIVILSLALATLFPQLSVLLFVVLGASIGGLYFQFVAQ